MKKFNGSGSLPYWLPAVFIGIIFAATFAMPFAMAAEPDVTNITYIPDPYYYAIPGQTAFVTFQYYYRNSGGATVGPLLEQIRNDKDDVVYQWDRIAARRKNTGFYTKVWDGTYRNGGTTDGQPVPEGQYKFYLLSEGATPPLTMIAGSYFTATKAVGPVVTVPTPPSSGYYDTHGDKYGVNYHIALESGTGATVKLFIKGKLDGNDVEIQAGKNAHTADGDALLQWDGLMGNMIAPPGQFTWTLTTESQVSGFGVTGEPVSGTFTVSDKFFPTPKLTNLTATPDFYNPANGTVTLGYTLGGSLGLSDITAAVIEFVDEMPVAKQWEFPAQGNGAKTIEWDGKDDAGNVVTSGGDYLFKVWGTDGNYSIIPQQIGLTVQVDSQGQTQQPAGNCPGFSDVLATDPDCAAIEYVKSTGAMTGNPDGTFAPYFPLQRDQIAKIVLESFGKFDASTDYCSGSDPFTDVKNTEWSYQYICRGKALAMITGYQSGEDKGYYRPGRAVNRAEFMAMILRNLGETMPAGKSYPDVPSDAWYGGYAKYAYDNGLYDKIVFEPAQFSTRIEVAHIIYALHELGKI